MLLTAVLLASALLLGGPALGLLARAPGTRRTPVATLVTWQLLAVASVESAVLASVAAALAVLSARQEAPVTVLLVAGAALVGGYVLVRLAVQGHRVGTRLRRIRRRHRELVDLTARVVDTPLRVVELAEQAAYCLPGWRDTGRVVVSQATWDRLDRDQLAAVLAHERAHLRWRHDLVVEAFTVLRGAAPSFVNAGPALAEVSLLVEVLADRAAVAEVGVRPLAGAIGASVDGPATAPEGGLGLGDEQVLARVELLSQPPAGGVRRSLTTLVNLLLAAWIVASAAWVAARVLATLTG